MRASVLVLLPSLLVLGCSPVSTVADAGADGGPTELRPDGGVTSYGALGPTVEENGDVKFRVFSSRAERVVVQLFKAAAGEDEVLERLLQREGSSDVWSAVVTAQELSSAGLSLPLFYGFRAWGPNWVFDAAWAKGSGEGFRVDVDAKGNRFNPNKLLLDPYAREVSHDPTYKEHLDEGIYQTGAKHRNRDSGKVAPKGIVLAPTPVDVGTRPARPLRDDIVYEVHARGFTRQDPSLEEACRGTYAAAGQKAAYLRELGVTAVEFLPVQETKNDTNDLAEGDGDNYWGYSTLAFFAPERRYACDRSPGGPTREFRAMAKAFHAQGIKVFIDVVYNHTAEGHPDASGDVALLRSLRGLDNAAYYQLTADGRRYRDDNGVSANVNAAHPAAQALILDSLRYWKEELGVDGFRFDSVSLLGNTCTTNCFRFSKAGLLTRIAREAPARPEAGGEGVDLIAEPWGVTDGTYQLGNFPKGWSEWNGQYRDTLRRDQNRLGLESVSPRALLTRLTGSPDLFGDDGRPPSASLNYLVSHDGFTLSDLFSCNEKKNLQPWPYGPSDGGENNNLSWDQGGVAALQRKAARNGLALLMLSAGVPMITGGDEMLRTQYCNNNPYNLDSNKNWLDWSAAGANASFRTFASRLMAFRSAHPALRPARAYRFGDGNNNGFKDFSVLTASAAEADGAYLDNDQNHFLGLWWEGAEHGDTAAALYVAYNGGGEKVTATLPPLGNGRKWYRVADTAEWMEDRSNFLSPGQEEALDVAAYELHPRSVLVLLER